jgi:hypothetical protein
MLNLYFQLKNFNDIESGAFVRKLLMSFGGNAVIILELPEDGVNKRQKV